MEYTRLYADDAGESHFEDVTVKFREMDYAPPSPPMGLSQMMTATQTGFLPASLNWTCEVSHPVSVKQLTRFARSLASKGRLSTLPPHIPSGKLGMTEQTNSTR